MAVRHLDGVLAVENAVYPFPWTRGNFVDSLAAGYDARVLHDAQGGVVGYLVAMAGVDEMHLLNVTVAPLAQGEGHARRLFDALVAICRGRGATRLWLEVRESNLRAREIYRHWRFSEVGRRRGYYPADQGRREDAIVMSLAITARGGGDALD
ncbi:MAG: ribosomal protein S18-alanine N-acetyltransferase [Proteobacteria bacterium]|nr:ribosomal protein S18-alanine N-acetyltransferase [Pseudomonadota bacterium]